MKYMIGRIDDEGIEFLYSWLWDRTRAIRKDLRCQALNGQEDIDTYLECFEHCARLSLLCLHHMSRVSEDSAYSHQQEVQQLGQTILSLKERYSDNRERRLVSRNEAEFQAYILIVGLYTRERMVEAEINRLPEPLRQNRRIQTALQIFRAGKLVIGRSRRLSEAQQNWKAFWDLVKSPAVSYLMACAAELLFKQIRHIVLDTLYRAYRRGNARTVIPMEDWTIPNLFDVLGFDTEKEVREFCGLYQFSFGTNADNQPFLDLTSRPAYGTSLGDEIPGPKAQTFSRGIVESKRYNRLLSAVIQGMSVMEARLHDLVSLRSPLTLNLEPEPEGEDEESLFVPENSTTNPIDSETNIPENPTFNPADPRAAGGLADSPSNNGDNAERSSQLNPFANPFQPSSKAANPFQSSSGPTNSLQSTSEPTNTLKSTSPFTNLFQSNSASPKPFQPSGASTNPFKPISTSTEPASAASTSFTQPNPFKPISTSVSGNVDSFASPSGSTYFLSRFGTPSTSTNTSSSQTSSTLATKPPAVTTSPATGQKIQPGIFNPLQNTVKFASTDSPSSLAVTPKIGPEQDEQQRKSQEQQRRAQEEQQKRDREEQQRQDREEQQRRAQEEQERRNREEQQRRAREEQERRAREKQERILKEEKERRAREEKERLARQEQERRTQEERERAEKRRRKEQKSLAFDALTENLMKDPEAGLLVQFVEQQVRTLLPGIMELVEQERAEKLANELYERRRLQLARSCVIRWQEKIIKKKRAGQARSRRKWLRENAEQLMAVANQSEEVSTPQSAIQTDTRPDDFKRPGAPASIRKRAKTEDKKPTIQNANGISNSKNMMTSSSSNYSGTNGVTAPPYKKSTAPIDRTETDWFKLRALGLDPSKHRKRSHDSYSDDDDEEASETERKRARTSPSSVSLASARSFQPSSKAEDDLFARFKALKARPSYPSTPRPQSSRQSPNNTSSIIARARAMLNKDTTPKNSPPRPEHEFSRSVPDLASQHLGISKSSFRKSFGIPATQGKPSYWSRPSRFVPTHLFGKGPDAVREYLQQSRGSTSTATSAEPLNLSSPIPAQQSYIPATHDAEYEYEDEDEDQDEEIEDADSAIEYEDEEYEEEYEEEEEEYGMEYDEEQNAQMMPGATQDDAIELSD